MNSFSAYVHATTGLGVVWLSNTYTCRYHASIDGRKAVCGAKNLTREPLFSWIDDPADCLPLCKRCAEFVRRRPRKVRSAS